MDNHNACESAWLNGYKAGLEGATKKPVDVAIVVRCKDCKYYTTGEHFPDIKFCFRLMHPTEEKHIGYNFSDDDFCSYGERREK